MNKNKEKGAKLGELNDNPINIYLLSERPLPGMYEYALDFGLHIQSVFTDIEEIKMALLMQEDASRVVIIESGIGKFTSTNARKDIIDLVGICDTEDKKISIFYTNVGLKEEIIRVLGKRTKEISWYKYRSTIDVITKIIDMREAYKANNSADSNVLNTEILGFKGIDTPNDNNFRESFYLLDNFNYDNKGETLESFKINI